MSDELSGQAVNAFVALKDGHAAGDPLRKELVLQVRRSIGPFAAPKAVFMVPDLPKTRSGKIMRRILRKILAGEEDALGDISTVRLPPLCVVPTDADPGTPVVRSQRRRSHHRGRPAVSSDLMHVRTRFLSSASDQTLAFVRQKSSTRVSCHISVWAHGVRRFRAGVDGVEVRRVVLSFHSNHLR